MQGNRRAGVPFLLILVANLLLVAAPAATVDKYSDQVIINYAAGSTRGNAHHAVTALMRRRLEDEVAPELISSRWPAGLGARNGGHISYDSLEKGPVCGDSCVGKPGKPYTRPCTYPGHCGQ